MSASGFSETTMNLVEIGQESVNHRPITALNLVLNTAFIVPSLPIGPKITCFCELERTS